MGFAYRSKTRDDTTSGRAARARDPAASARLSGQAGEVVRAEILRPNGVEEPLLEEARIGLEIVGHLEKLAEAHRGRAGELVALERLLDFFGGRVLAAVAEKRHELLRSDTLRSAIRVFVELRERRRAREEEGGGGGC